MGATRNRDYANSLFSLLQLLLLLFTVVVVADMQGNLSVRKGRKAVGDRRNASLKHRRKDTFEGRARAWPTKSKVKFQ